MGKITKTRGFSVNQDFNGVREVWYTDTSYTQPVLQNTHGHSLRSFNFVQGALFHCLLAMGMWKSRSSKNLNNIITC